MYQYFFEGDTVRLAYWRVDYGENKTMYANTAECKQDIVAMLTQQGYTPKVSEINQAGNEWIDGMCFTDHSTVDAALEAGCKNFMCDGDMEAVVDTLTTMNDSMFHVDEDNVWHITVPSVPSFSCYNVMVCITTSSVDNQMISINNGAAIPLMKSAIDPVLAYDIKASDSEPLAVQLNITEDKAYLNASANEAWQLGEIKSFGYRRPTVETELFCDGTAFDKEKYPELFDLIKDNYAVPAEYIQCLSGEQKVNSNVIYANGVTYGTDRVVITANDMNAYVYSLDETFTRLGSGSIHNVSGYSRLVGPVFANGIFYHGVYLGSNDRWYLSCSTDGLNWTTCQTGSESEDFSFDVCYSDKTKQWILAVYICGSKFVQIYYSNDGKSFTYQTGQSVPFSAGYYSNIRPYICYLKDADCYLVKVAYSNTVYVYTMPSSLIGMKLAYTIEVADGTLSGSALVRDNCAIFSYGAKFVYVLTAEGYNIIYLPDGIASAASYATSNCLAYSPAIDSVIVINPYGTVALDLDALSAKQMYKCDGVTCTISSSVASYDSEHKRVLFADNQYNTHILDVSNTSLPPLKSDGYDYIKAK